MTIGLRQIAFLLVPASVVCAVLAEPIVRVVYQRGDFTPAQTPVVAASLAAFSLGLVFNGFMLMLNRAFFSLQSPWMPTWVALGNLALNAVLDAAFYRFGVWGLPLSTSLVNIAGAAALLRPAAAPTRTTRPARDASAFVRIVAASAVSCAIAYGVWRLHEALGRGVVAQLVSLGTALLAATAAYGLACRALGVHELRALLSLRRRR